MCPTEKEELEAFREEHEGKTFWCGTKFEEGCGAQLTTRRMEDKVCHFAHFPSAQRCTRRSNSETSADHLFVKIALAASFAAQGIEAEFSYPSPLGSAVRARLADGRNLLVHLAQDLPVPYHEQGLWQIMLGPGVRIDPDTHARLGHIHRVRFPDRRNRRTVLFGTQYPATGTEWFPPPRLRLIADRLIDAEGPVPPSAPTPTAPGQRSHGTPIVRMDSGSAERDATLPEPRISSDSRRAVDRMDDALRRDLSAAVTAATRAIEGIRDQPNTTDEDARLLNGALKRAEQWQGRRAHRTDTVMKDLRIQYESGHPSPELLAQAKYLTQDPTTAQHHRDFVREVTEELLEALRHREETARLRKEEAEQRWLERQATALREAKERRKARERAAQQNEEQRARQQLVDSVASLERITRGALRKAAREDRVVTWEGLAKSTGIQQLENLTTEQKLELLAMVDQNTATDQPLLTCLITADGRTSSLHLHRNLAERFSRTVPESNAELHTHIRTQLSALRRTHT